LGHQHHAPRLDAEIAVTKAGDGEHAFQLAHLERLAVVERPLAHQTEIRRAPTPRPPAQEFQAIVRFREHPAIGYGKVTHAIRLHDASNLGEMLVLRPYIADVFDDVVADDDIETGIPEREVYALHQLEGVAIARTAVVTHIHRADLAAELGMHGEPVRDAAGAGADFQQAHGLRPAGEIQQARNLQG